MSEFSRMEERVEDENSMSPIMPLTQSSSKSTASSQPADIPTEALEEMSEPEEKSSEGPVSTQQELRSPPVMQATKRIRLSTSPNAEQDQQADLHRVIEELTGEMKNLRSDFIQTKKDLTKEITELKKSLEYQGAELDDIKAENTELKSVLDVVQGMSVRNMDKTSGLHEKVLEMECKLMENDLVVFGIPEVQGRATGSLLDTMKGFLSVTMKVEGKIEIAQCFRIGAKKPEGIRPIMVRLVHLRDKFRILKNGTNLKSTSFRVSEHLPRDYEERRKSLLPSFRDAKLKGVPVRWSKDTLVVNKKIQQVRKDKISDYNQDVVAEASKISVKRPPPHEGGSGSTLHAAKVSIAEASDVMPSLHAVMRVNRFATAKTSVYAYRLARNNGEVLEHFEDDGDNGAGRLLREFMREEGLVNQLICVSRHEGRPTTTRARHGDIINAAKSVLGL